MFLRFDLTRADTLGPPLSLSAPCVAVVVVALAIATLPRATLKVKGMGQQQQKQKTQKPRLHLPPAAVAVADDHFGFGGVFLHSHSEGGVEVRIVEFRMRQLRGAPRALARLCLSLSLLLSLSPHHGQLGNETFRSDRRDRLDTKLN